MTELKKAFPPKGEVLGIPHVNSGFTYSCAPSNEIHIYRAEEWFKILIHESFHSLHLDFSSMDDNVSNNFIYKIIPLDLDLRMYESYTDAWSDIIHTAFIAGSLSRFKRMFEIERSFSMYQCARILHHYGLSYKDIFDPSSKYKEGSPVMSYYIIKSCFHFFLDDFLKWCAVTNRGSIQFKHTNGTIISYCELYQKICKNNFYVTYLFKLEEVLNKRIPKVMENTLRRTILD